jgi:uncharacterized protein (DUF952 family)
MNVILHIAEPQAWQQAQTTGSYRAASLETEGFIHCSTPKQLIKVADRFYRDRQGLVLLYIDSQKLLSEIRYDTVPEENEQFPHIYGEINLDAVFRFSAFASGEDGYFKLPSDLQKSV